MAPRKKVVAPKVVAAHGSVSKFLEGVLERHLGYYCPTTPSYTKEKHFLKIGADVYASIVEWAKRNNVGISEVKILEKSLESSSLNIYVRDSIELESRRSIYRYDVIVPYKEAHTDLDCLYKVPSDVVYITDWFLGNILCKIVESGDRSIFDFGNVEFGGGHKIIDVVRSFGDINNGELSELPGWVPHFLPTSRQCCDYRIEGDFNKRRDFFIKYGCREWCVSLFEEDCSLCRSGSPRLFDYTWKTFYKHCVDGQFSEEEKHIVRIDGYDKGIIFLWYFLKYGN